MGIKFFPSDKSMLVDSIQALTGTTGSKWIEENKELMKKSTKELEDLYDILENKAKEESQQLCHDCADKTSVDPTWENWYYRSHGIIAGHINPPGTCRICGKSL